MPSPTVDAPTPISPVRSLRKNISWTTAGNVIYAACQWGVITALAKIGSPTMVGQFALALAITAPIMQFMSFHLRSVQATDARREYLFSDYFSLRTITTFIAVIICLIVGISGDYPRETVTVILLVTVAKGADAFSDVFYGLFQQHERMDVISKALVINGVLSVILLTTGVWITGEIVIGVMGYTVSSFVPLALYVVPQARHLIADSRDSAEGAIFYWRSDDIRRLARAALPLGIVMLLISLNTNVPRYFIEAELGTHELGIYAALAYLIVAGGTVVSAVGQAVSPRLSQHYAARRTRLFRSMLLKLMGVGLTLGVVGALLALIAGRQILSLLYTSEYAEHIDVLVILAIAAGLTFAASFAGYGMTATRQFAVQVPVFVLVVLVGLLASWILIPRTGLVGAACVTGLSALVQLAASSTVIYKASRTVAQ